MSSDHGGAPTHVAYLDHAATTPMHPLAIEALAQQLGRVGNASSLHDAGRAARRVVEESRELVAELDANGDEVALVSVMWANNEVGTVQPLAEVVELAHRYGIPVHADAVQAVGQLSVDFAASGLDAMTVTGHKVGGPVGLGTLLMRRDLAVTPVPV